MSSTGTPPAHRRALLGVAVLTAATLLVTAGLQIYDVNLYVLSEATALLQGDRPGRDFFSIGAPLESYFAAAAQLASGGRLIGEFVRQWLYIVAGVVIAFHLGLRLSRSVTATLVMLVPALAILANTPTYHASKLLFFPLFIWCAWRYLEQPSVRRGAVLGAVNALAFLTRHDYGLYLGFGSVLAFVVGRFAMPRPRDVRVLSREAAAYAAAVFLVIAPWAASVQLTEGLAAYTRMRVLLYEQPGRTPYAALLDLNPIRAFSPPGLPAAEPGVVQFVWRPDIDDRQQQDLEQTYRLRRLEGRDGRDRLRYEVPTVYDVRFLDLEPYIRDPTGFPWDRLKEARSRVPSRDSLNVWLLQVALAIPLVLVAAGGLRVWRNGRGELDGWRMTVAGAFLAIVNGALFREPGYVVVTAPVIAALSARFLVGGGLAGRACAVLVLAPTVFAAVMWARPLPIFAPREVPGLASRAYERLLASPPVAAEPKFRYLYECSTDGDRVLITGATPSLVSYYANRPMAGGHGYWHHGWLSDPESEARSLELLERQSVPFVMSTHDPVFDDFKRYPRIREYLTTHYASLDATNGTILVDTRRQPTGRFGPRGYPCFK